MVSEPSGAQTFFPVSDHPTDKATYTIRVTAPEDQTVAANGLLVGENDTGHGTRSWTYEVTDPMASYLVQIAIGDYELVDAGTAGDVPIRHAFHRSQLEDGHRGHRGHGGDDRRCSTTSTGRSRSRRTACWPWTRPLGFALETQTLTIIGSDIAADRGRADQILLHELAHQWVGDAVSPATWKDIWLNEGFATYAEWLWLERTGGPRRPTRRAGTRARPSSIHRRATQDPTSCSAARLHPRRHDVAGAPRAGGRRRLLRDPPHLDRRAPRQHGLHRGLHRAGRGDQRRPARRAVPDVAVRRRPARPLTRPYAEGNQAGRVRLEVADGVLGAQGDADVVEALEEPLAHGVLQREVDLEADGRRGQGAAVDVDDELEGGVGLHGLQQLLADLGRHRPPARGRSSCSCCGRCRRSAG